MMVHKAEDNAASLLSNPSDENSPIYERKVAEYQDLSDRFKKLNKKDFSKQFSHIYSLRLAALNDVLVEKVNAKWENIPVFKLANLDESNHAECIIIGTLYKHQELKPSILRDLSEELQLAPPAARSNYCSSKDQLFLEDEMLRIKLVGNHVDLKEMVTGVVCAVLGYEKEDGTFDVEDCCFPGCLPQPPRSLDSGGAGKLVLVSGLDLANKANSLASNLLMEWLDGMIGDPASQKEEASVVRLIIAGNSVRGKAEIHTEKGHSLGLAQDNAAAKETALATHRFDNFLSQIVESCCVTLMPGEFDPTNHMLPQQPMHPCVLPKSSRFKSLHGATNPWVGRVGPRIICGSSGQPIKDIAKVCDVEDVSPIVWLERTLNWRHFCPTAPDTLSLYPYYENDPFIMTECPDVYFVSNMDKYETKLWKGDEGQIVRLICIPKFSETETAVLVDLATLETQPISFGSG